MLNKLDMLQNMICENHGDPFITYLAGLLAEHAEEEEMTERFLLWIKMHYTDTKVRQLSVVPLQPQLSELAQGTCA